ncbi:MAG: M48 family metalloprotease [Phycisphaerae bacterium]|nr:M48 family metalloprotease [Phycisphaerae bacterium]
MIAPLQQILLIFIISAYRAVGAVTSGHLSPWATLWVVLSGNMALVLAAWQFRKRTLRRMDHATDPLAVLGTFEQNLQRLRSMSIGWLALNLFFMDWGRLVREARWRLPHGTAYTWIPLDPIIWLALPVLVWICFWLAQYGPEALVNAREAAISGCHGRRFHPMPTRLQYVILQMRTNLYLILLVLMIWAMQRGTTRLAERVGLENWASAIGLIPVLVVLLLAGKILSMLWSTVTMPEGPLRRRLLAMAQRSGIVFSDVRIWNTHHRIINGAVIGPMRVARYVILSDALVENLSPGEVEAVFAHELGHGYHRHILWYLTAILAASLVSAGLSSLLQLQYPQDPQLWGAMTMLAMVFFVVYGISRISRLCEHQADWFAAQRMGEEWSLAAGQVGGQAESSFPAVTLRPPAAQRVVEGGLFLTPWLMDHSVGSASAESPLERGAWAFSTALRRVVELSGRSPEKPGWMHPSVNQRTQLLAKLAASPDAVRRFEGKMKRLRQLIRWGLLIGLVSVVMAVALASAARQPSVSPMTSPEKSARPPHFVHMSGEWMTRNTAVGDEPVEPARAAIAAPLAQ